VRQEKVHLVELLDALGWRRARHDVVVLDAAFVGALPVQPDRQQIARLCVVVQHVQKASVLCTSVWVSREPRAASRGEM